MFKTFLVIAATAFAIAAPASADPLEIRVPTQGIDLASSEDRAELAQRAKRIAIDECGTASAADRHSRRAVRECREQVVDAVARHAAAQRLAETAR